MKIITTTYEDFIRNEIAEYGHDYVEAQFLSGYEPTIVNGIWVWHSHGVSSKGSVISCSVSSSTIRSGDSNTALSRQPQLLS